MPWLIYILPAMKVRGLMTALVKYFTSFVIQHVKSLLKIGIVLELK